MIVFPSLGDEPGMDALARKFPGTWQPLLELHDRVMCDASPLTVAERELIAAYVSGLNACAYCHGAHRIAAEAFGVDGELVEALIENPGAAGPRLQPLLAYVGKLTRTPSRIVPEDAETVFAAGWPEQALFDAISVCALFNYMNRIVDGSGMKADPLTMSDADKAARRKRLGDDGNNPYASRPRYSALAKAWKLPGM